MTENYHVSNSDLFVEGLESQYEQFCQSVKEENKKSDLLIDTPDRTRALFDEEGILI